MCISLLSTHSVNYRTMEREDIVIGGKNFLDNNITNCSHFL